MRDCISFVLNGRLETLRNVPPATTLLNYLRKTKRLTGTKEGCAEGDCGACTVAIGELRDGEHASSRRQRLHSLAADARRPQRHDRRASAGCRRPRCIRCSRRMVDAHGSQCGFCTPGFVMSLYATVPQRARSRAARRIDDVLAGNLCRCTGYGPIVKAAQAMYDLPRDCRHADDAADLAQLKPSPTARPSCSKARGAACSRRRRSRPWPASTPSIPEASILSGATDVGLWITKQHRRHPASSSRPAACRSCRPCDRGRRQLRIGAAVTWSDLEGAIGAALSRLRRAAAPLRLRAGAQRGHHRRQYRQRLPHRRRPAGADRAGRALVLRKGASGAHDCRWRISSSPTASRTASPASSSRPSSVPLLDRPSGSSATRSPSASTRTSPPCLRRLQYRLADGTVRDARICYGGMAATPKRAAACEAALVGRPWTLATVMDALPAFDRDYSPLTDMRGVRRLPQPGGQEPAGQIFPRDGTSAARDAPRRARSGVWLV